MIRSHVSEELVPDEGLFFQNSDSCISLLTKFIYQVGVIGFVLRITPVFLCLDFVQVITDFGRRKHDVGLPAVVLSVLQKLGAVFKSYHFFVSVYLRSKSTVFKTRTVTYDDY